MRHVIRALSFPLGMLLILLVTGCRKHREVKVVNMIPTSLSGESNQDSEPKLTVDLENHRLMVASAFTPNPAGTGSGLAPVYVSQDAGETWTLTNIVPSAGSLTGTGDITESATRDRRLYAGILKVPGFLTLNELFTSDFTSTTSMTVQASRNSVDQPFVNATTSAGGDRVYVGNNDFSASPRTATVDFSANGSAPYKSIRLEPRATSGQDGPSIRVTIAKDETVYGAYFGWRTFNGTIATSDVVVVRDDHGATGSTPFQDLKDSGGVSGVFAAHSVNIPWSNAPTMGQERIGSTLSIAVDPKHSSTVYVAWGDRVGTGDIYTIHIRRSIDRGVNWSGDLRTIVNATNCALAVTEDGVVGFLYQQVTGSGPSRWETHLEQSKDAFTTVDDTVLATVPSDVPVHTFLPYLGDYDFLLAVDDSFRGIFSANNTPDSANFPHGVKYQRMADFATKTLQNGAGGTVPISIDPFYFQVEAIH
jgi:hypothetical protein